MVIICYDKGYDMIYDKKDQHKEDIYIYIYI